MTENKPKPRKKLKRGRPRVHGGISFLATGELPTNRRYLRIYLTEVREGLIRDLGPTEEDLTTAQKIIIDRIITKLGVLRLIEEHVRQTKAIEKGRLVPCLRESYLTFNNSIRLSLQALGIDKRVTDEALDLGTYLEQKKKEKEGNEQTTDS